MLNKPGVLNRVASLMRARNFNIDSLAVSHTDSDDVSRMTITLHGDDVAVEQAAKQLYRLIDVLKVQDVTSEPTVQQELALVKIRATDSTRAEVLKLVELSRGRVVDVADGSVIVEVTGTESEVDAFVALVRTYGIKELVRTGAVVMARGSGSIEEASSDDGEDLLRQRRRPGRAGRARPSRSSATAARATPTPSTCTSPASTSSSGSRRGPRAGRSPSEAGLQGRPTWPMRSRPPT